MIWITDEMRIYKEGEIMKYTCYDWYGNKKADNIYNLKEAVREALKLECEIHDERGDISF